MVANIQDILNQYSYGGETLGNVSGPVDLGGPGSGKSWWLKTQGPQMWSLFAKWAGARGGPIDESTRGAFAEQVAGLTAGRAEADRALGASSAAAGVSPSIYRGMQAEGVNQYLTAVGGARAGAEAARGTALFNLGANTTAAINDEIARNKALKTQSAIAADQRSLERSAGRSAQRTALIGAGLSAVSMGLGPGWMKALGAGKSALGSAGAWSDSQHGGNADTAGYGGGIPSGPSTPYDSAWKPYSPWSTGSVDYAGWQSAMGR